MKDYISKALHAGNPLLLSGAQIYLRRAAGGSIGFTGFIRNYSSLLALAISIVVLADSLKH